MKLPRDLSGQELANALMRKWGYTYVHTVGSHIIVITDSPSHHRLSIPDHRFLRVGTLNAILRAVAQLKGVPKEDIVESL